MTQTMDAEQILKDLKSIPENNYCFDCGNEDSDWSSINNGIFLCTMCSEFHRGLGVNISFIRSVSIDTWQDKQLKLLQVGGNLALKEFFSLYGLNEQEISIKYKTKAADYYREMLRIKAEDQEFNKEAPDVETGVEIIEETKNFVEPGHLDEKNLPIKVIIEDLWVKYKEKAIESFKTLSQKIKDLTFDEVKEKTKEGIKDLGHKIETFNFKETYEHLRNKSEEVYDSIKESTKNTYETSKEKIENSKNSVKEILEKSKEKIIETYESSKEKILDKYNSTIGKSLEAK
ncbi:hypothetical protein SteCoe_2610 [Stentor coeruleus]|uniref:Arf-GAP domain-containing protein n=1 Tax=Stentor coeruleus TaxID=5963 RepID=A0A1R2CZ39_9CILI|nr:hypothetical protein SteCoe_2610 [Stentor coeruleus]